MFDFCVKYAFTTSSFDLQKEKEKNYDKNALKRKDKISCFS